MRTSRARVISGSPDLSSRAISRSMWNIARERVAVTFIRMFCIFVRMAFSRMRRRECMTTGKSSIDWYFLPPPSPALILPRRWRVYACIAAKNYSAGCARDVAPWEYEITSGRLERGLRAKLLKNWTQGRRACISRLTRCVVSYPVFCGGAARITPACE